MQNANGQTVYLCPEPAGAPVVYAQAPQQQAPQVPPHTHPVPEMECDINVGTLANPCASTLGCGKGLIVDSADETIIVDVSTDADGNTVIDLSCNCGPDGDGLVDNGNMTWTYTGDDGSTTLVVDTDTWTTVTDNGNGNYTATNADGSMVTWETQADTWTNVEDNGDGSFTFTLPNGDVVDIPAPTDCCPTLEPQADGTYLWTGGDGVQQVLDFRPPNLVDNQDGTYTYTPAPSTGDPVVTIIDTDTWTTVTDNGDGTWTLEDPDGNTTVINNIPDTDTFSTMTDNGDGTYTFTPPGGGTPITISTGSGNTSKITDNGDGTYLHEDGSGNAANNVTICTKKQVDASDATSAQDVEYLCDDDLHFRTAGDLSKGGVDRTVDLDLPSVQKVGSDIIVDLPSNLGWHKFINNNGDTGVEGAGFNVDNTANPFVWHQRPNEITVNSVRPARYYVIFSFDMQVRNSDFIDGVTNATLDSRLMINGVNQNLIAHDICNWRLFHCNYGISNKQQRTLNMVTDILPAGTNTFGYEYMLRNLGGFAVGDVRHNFTQGHFTVIQL